MPKIVKVKCSLCGGTDEAVWSDYGAEQPCFNCDAAAVYLENQE